MARLLLNDPARTVFFSLSLHDALPISLHAAGAVGRLRREAGRGLEKAPGAREVRRARRGGRCGGWARVRAPRSEEHTSELQSRLHLVCRPLLEKKKDRVDGFLFCSRPL